MPIDNLRDDLLTGADAISRFIGWPVRKIYHAHAARHLPIGNAGHILIARKSELSEALSAKHATPRKPRD